MLKASVTKYLLLIKSKSIKYLETSQTDIISSSNLKSSILNLCEMSAKLISGKQNLEIH